MPFTAEAGVPYQFWFHMKAAKNQYTSDSVYVQFSDCHRREPAGDLSHRVDHGRVGDSRGQFGRGRCGMGMDRQLIWLAGGADLFATPGPQTLRIQTREDGVSIDQIVISGGTVSDDAAGGDEKRRDQGAETVTVALG